MVGQSNEHKRQIACFCGSHFYSLIDTLNINGEQQDNRDDSRSWVRTLVNWSQFPIKWNFFFWFAFWIVISRRYWSIAKAQDSGCQHSNFNSLLTSCMILCKLLNFFVPKFLVVKWGWFKFICVVAFCEGLKPGSISVHRYYDNRFAHVWKCKDQMRLNVNLQGKSKALDTCDSFHSFILECHVLCYKLAGGREWAQDGAYTQGTHSLMEDKRHIIEKFLYSIMVHEMFLNVTVQRTEGEIFELYELSRYGIWNLSSPQTDV